MCGQRYRSEHGYAQPKSRLPRRAPAHRRLADCCGRHVAERSLVATSVKRLGNRERPCLPGLRGLDLGSPAARQPTHRSTEPKTASTGPRSGNLAAISFPSSTSKSRIVPGTSVPLPNQYASRRHQAPSQETSARRAAGRYILVLDMPKRRRGGLPFATSSRKRTTSVPLPNQYASRRCQPRRRKQAHVVLRGGTSSSWTCRSDAGAVCHLPRQVANGPLVRVSCEGLSG